jgi:hypothetical protein
LTLALQSADAEDLARARVEIDRPDAAADVQPPCEQHDICSGRRACRIEALDAAPEHRRNQVIVAVVADYAAEHVTPAAQHRQAVRRSANLGEPMGDEEHDRALFRCAPRMSQHPAAVLRRQRRGGLVEDEDPCRLAQRLGHLEQLAVAEAELVDGCARIDACESDPFEQLIRRRTQRTTSYKTERQGRFTSVEQALGDGQARNRAQLLEGRPHAGAFCACGTAECQTGVVEQNPAAIRPGDAGQDLDHRRLAGAVLAEDRVNLAALRLDIDALERLDRAVALCESRDQQRCGHSAGVTPGATNRPRSARTPIIHRARSPG